MQQKTKSGIIWTIFGILFIAIFVMATSTINENGITTVNGTFTGSLLNLSSADIDSVLDIIMNGNLTLNSGFASITNPSTNNGLKLDQNGNTSTSTSVGGAFLLENTGNAGSGLIIYSNKGTSTSGARLFNVRADNSLFDGRALSVDYDGIGDAVFFDNRGNGTSNSALEVVSANTWASSMGLSGNESDHGTLKITHHYPNKNDSNAAVLSIDIADVGTAAQGIFITSNGNTTGDLVDFRNYGFQLFRIDDYGMVQIYQNRTAFTCDGTTAGGIYYDGSTKKHYGCNGTGWSAFY